MNTAFIVFGRDDIFLVPSALGTSWRFNEASRVDAIDDVDSRRIGRAACDTKVMEFEASGKLCAEKMLDWRC